MADDQVDNKARTGIALLNQKIEHLSDNLEKHMSYEEKMRDRFEDVVNGLGKRVSTLSRIIWVALGSAGGLQALRYIPM